MTRKRKIPELTFICPKCGESPKPNTNSNDNFDCYDTVCPECNVKYDLYLDNKKLGEK